MHHPLRTTSKDAAEALYPKVALRMLSDMQRNDTDEHYYGYDRLEDSDSHLPYALISTEHSYYIQVLLQGGVRQNVHDSMVFAYAAHGQYEKVIELFRIYDDHHSTFSIYEYHRFLLEHDVPDSAYIGFVRYLLEIHSFSLIDDVLEGLWEQQKYSFAETLIDLCPEELQPLLRVHHSLRTESRVTQDIAEASDRADAYVASLNSTHEDAADEVRSMLKSLIKTVDIQTCDLSQIYALIESLHSMYEAADSHLSFDMSGVDHALFEAFLERGDFEKAETLSTMLGFGHYRNEMIYRSKIKSAEQSQDQALHKEALQCLKATLQSRIQESEESEYRSWRCRIDRHRDRAHIYAEQALFELHFGSREKAQEYMQQMMSAVFSIGQPPEDLECPVQHRKTLRDFRRMYKRDIKERFYRAGFFHELPEKNGWNHAIKDPDQRQQERAARREAKERKHDERRREYEEGEKREKQQKRLFKKSKVRK